MAWTLINHTTVYSAGSGGVTTTAISTIGANLIALVGLWFGNTAPSAPTDNQTGPTNTYASAGTPSQTASGASIGVWYSAQPHVGSSHTFLFGTGGAFYPSLMVQAWSGAAAAPADQYNATQLSTSGVSIQPGSITPSQSGALVVTGLSVGSAETGGIGISGYITPDTLADFVSGTSMGGGSAYLVETGNPATNPTWTWTGVATAASAVASFTVAATASCAPGLMTLGVGCGVSMIGWTPALLRSPLPILGGAAVRLGKAMRRNAITSRRALLTGHNVRPKF